MLGFSGKVQREYLKTLPRILSVDWDFFFPNGAWFDWGHVEAPIFYEQIWWLRCSAYNLKTGEMALNTMVPDKRLLDGFWGKVIQGRPKRIFVTDSHLELYKLLEEIGKPCLVDNYDAHHDFCYDATFSNVDCGNWAGKAKANGLIEHYHLFYPPWRKQEPENGDRRFEVTYGIDWAPKKYDYLFICRSSAWTPTWADDQWLKFIGRWQRFWVLAENIVEKRVAVARKPNMAEARQAMERSHLMTKAFMDKLKSGTLPKAISSKTRRSL